MPLECLGSRVGPLAALAFACVCSSSLAGAQLAFPGAEGYGRFASGGRGGSVIEVTNLNDSGPGSLRDAVGRSGPRTVVFRVSGTIYLQSDLSIRNDDITIAGQTAPGDGICLANYTLSIGANNVIVRFLRVRVGDKGSAQGADGRDACFTRYTDRVIIDHCSFSWSIDETASAYFNTNFTMQWCMATESLRLSLHSKSDHGYGGIWGGQGATFHHNLLAHHTSRNPRFNGSRSMPATVDGIEFTLERVDHRDNVIYNWSGNSAYAGEARGDGVPSQYNIARNYYKAGPATPSSKNDRIFQPTGIDVNGLTVYSQFFLEGNKTTANASTTQSNWDGIDGPTSAEKEVMRAEVAFASAPITEQSADRSFEYVLAYSGCSYPKRDSVDERIVNEVRTGTSTFGANGIIDSQDQVGGWPELASAPAPADGDHDGMPDAWELEAGLDPEDASDRNGDANGDGFTNLENYLNGLVDHLYPEPNLTIEPNGQLVRIQWSNYPNNHKPAASSDLVEWSPIAEAAQGSEGEIDLSLAGEAATFLRLQADE